MSTDVAETVIDGIEPAIEAMNVTAAKCAGSRSLALGILVYCTFVATSAQALKQLTRIADALEKR